MSPDPETQLTKVRALALAMPASAERLSHGSPGFHIEKGKFFAYFWHNHHSDGETIVIVKTSGREEQEMLIEMDPDCYFSPPYMGPSGWIALRLDRPDTDWDRVADRIALSWEMVAPRKLLEMGGQMSETPEQAATRRRWISLAEAVAVAGVLIAAISLYLSWSDKREERAEKAAATQTETKAASVITLRATVAKGGERLDLADAAHPVDGVDIALPAALGVTAQTGLVKPVIEASWIKDALNGDAKSGRLPVLITSTFWEGEVKRTDRAIYDVAWRSEGGLFGHSLKFDGMALRERGGSQARLDAIWKQVAPKPKQ